MYCVRRDIIKKHKCIICFCIYEHTLVAFSLCISRTTSSVTMTRQLVTGKSITTVNTTVVVTTITIGPAITFCNKLYLYEVNKKKNIVHTLMKEKKNTFICVTYTKIRISPFLVYWVYVLVNYERKLFLFFLFVFSFNMSLKVLDIYKRFLICPSVSL